MPKNGSKLEYEDIGLAPKKVAKTRNKEVVKQQLSSRARNSSNKSIRVVIDGHTA